MKLLTKLIILFLLFVPLASFAHRSGCHRWHSCPSDTGSYTCGDVGYPCRYPTYSTRNNSNPSNNSSSSSRSGSGSSYNSLLKLLPKPIVLGSSTDETLVNRLLGRILLAVESRGKAWYLNPDTRKRYYLGLPDDAFKVMQGLGTGANNSDLARIMTAVSNLTGLDTDNDSLPDSFEEAVGTNKTKSDTDDDTYDDRLELESGYNPIQGNAQKLTFDDKFAKTQKGRILLQVESKGEAWYINPIDSKRYYLGRPSDAYNLMKDLGLGITDSDLSKIPVGEP